ncbi:MAG: tRNA (guanosine(46)-N7)-methyltransferase TrmB [Verrucomicrobia bacterium]|nr:tRNA (guanosine(46)-N7)-methyltransferase TrmB [Verrucomicrobiota bacterium]
MILETPTALPTQTATLIHRPASFFEPLELDELFSAPQPLEVELGAGDGSFLANYAARHLDRNFLGVERLLGRLRKIDRKGLRGGLRNLRLIRVEASYLIQYLLPSESVAALHVYFPDPWPKRKHRKNRLVNAAFVELARAVLKPVGTVFLRTDDADYFTQMTEVFRASSAFSAIPTPPELAEVTTDFEREFQARGVPTLRVAYQRR